MAVPIYDVEITDWVNKKINAKKPGITADEVWDVCYEPRRHNARWHDHPVHGRRLIVRGRTPGGRSLRIILHPVDVELGKWRLKTAIAENG
ncbi:hypothetical protein [Mycobacterium avium]|uniref:hypothetical protein n=1 Tax=Mycobacterium avium TaxID=1764 RepID=UPI001070BCE2|nr:hypothetical protein [Mycobacterium avium]